MVEGRSREDLLKFVDYLSNKGLIPSSTASARKASANKVLSILGDDEAADVLALDLDHLMVRFSNLNGQQYTPKSLADYRSRLRSTIDDFKAYVDNPLGFKPGGRVRPKICEVGDKSKSKKSGRILEKKEVSAALGPQAISPSLNILPIPLRANLTVQVAGLPFDLTASEAKKIANIILAHALHDD